VTTTIKPVKRSIVSLTFRLPSLAFITMARASSRSTPDPPIATISTALTALETAEAAVQARQRGAVGRAPRRAGRGRRKPERQLRLRRNGRVSRGYTGPRLSEDFLSLSCLVST
jgi:hypothetical protein